MRERPILFSAPMVLALLAGRKGQTRRVVKLKKEPSRIGAFGPIVDERTVWCPYGVPGDRLWVREAWRVGAKLDGSNATQIEKSAEDAGFGCGPGRPACPIRYEADQHAVRWGADDMRCFGELGRLRSSRFMPRWASRITLEITGVKVERVQDISEEDARAEGVVPHFVMDAADFIAGKRLEPGTCRKGFEVLWKDINGPESWNANPWVWAISFRRVAP
jgi:hypothetical protein